MNPAKVMFVLTLYNDHLQAVAAVKTLTKCHLPGVTDGWEGHSHLFLLDATEQDPKHNPLRGMGDQFSHCQYRHYDNRPGLPEVLNDAIAKAIEMKLDYVAWIHPDMDFSYDPLWLARCILWLEDEPICGKVSPSEFKTRAAADASNKSGVPIQGNACPWVMRTVDLKELWDKEGWVLDPAYKLMHYEDWDLINRINLELGKVAHIIPWAQVVHEGMGTRKKHDYEDSLQVNREYFEQKWGMSQHL